MEGPKYFHNRKNSILLIDPIQTELELIEWNQSEIEPILFTRWIARFGPESKPTRTDAQPYPKVPALRRSARPHKFLTNTL